VHLDATHYPFDVRPPFRPAAETGPLSLAEFEKILVAGGPPEAFQRLENLYEAALRQSDSIVGSIVSKLESARRPGGPPLVAIVDDHGSHRGERGIWFVHSTLYRPVLHVPFILYGPGRLPAGERRDRLVRLIDAGPTLLDYAGLDPGGFEGRSLRSLIERRPDPGIVNFIRQPLDGLLVVENDRFKLIANPRKGGINWPRMPSLAYPMPTIELFDWRRDPAEKNDLAPREPLIVGELWRQATAARALVERRMTADARRLLEQAGYAEPVVAPTPTFELIPRRR
jgi:arylsulfatase A-like enzyme